MLYGIFLREEKLIVPSSAENKEREVIIVRAGNKYLKGDRKSTIML